MPQKFFKHTEIGTCRRQSCGCFTIGPPKSSLRLLKTKSLNFQLSDDSSYVNILQTQKVAYGKRGSRVIDRKYLTNKQYLKLLACPKNYPYSPNCCKKKIKNFSQKGSKIRSCQAVSLANLAKPNKAHIFETLYHYQNILSPQQITNLNQRLQGTAPNIEEANACFKKIKKREKILKARKKNKMQKHINVDSDINLLSGHISLIATKLTACLCSNLCLQLNNERKKISARIVYYLIQKTVVKNYKNIYFMNAVHNASNYIVKLLNNLEKLSGSSATSTPTESRKIRSAPGKKEETMTSIIEEEASSFESECTEDFIIRTVTNIEELEDIAEEFNESDKDIDQEIISSEIASSEEKEAIGEEEFEEAAETNENLTINSTKEENESYIQNLNRSGSNTSEEVEFNLNKLIEIASEYYNQQGNNSKLQVFSKAELPEVFFIDMLTNLKIISSKERESKPEAKLASEYQKKLTTFVNAVDPKVLNEKASATIYFAANALAKQTLDLLKRGDLDFGNETLERVEDLENKTVANVQDQEEKFEDASDLLLEENANKELKESHSNSTLQQKTSEDSSGKKSELIKDIIYKEIAENEQNIKDEGEGDESKKPPISKSSTQSENEVLKTLQAEEIKLDIITEKEEQDDEENVREKKEEGRYELKKEEEEEENVEAKEEGDNVLKEEDAKEEEQKAQDVKVFETVIDETSHFHDEVEIKGPYGVKNIAEDYYEDENPLEEELMKNSSQLEIQDEQKEMYEVKSAEFDAEQLNVQYNLDITPHGPDKVCCASLKVLAQWINDVADNNKNWWLWMLQTIQELRDIVLILKGQVYDKNGVTITLRRQDWNHFVWKLNADINEWYCYNRHIQELSVDVMQHFHNKPVHCCTLCEKESYNAEEVDIEHLSNQLADALKTINYWRKWLNKLVKNVGDLTTALEDESFIEVASSDVLLAISKSMMTTKNETDTKLSSGSLYSISRLY